MKKLSSLLAGSFFLLLSVGMHAQSKTGADYFTGKWNVLITGTPYGVLRAQFWIVQEKKYQNALK